MSPSAVDLGAELRDALDATRDAMRRRGLDITLSTPARAVRVAVDDTAFRAELRRRLRAALDALPDAAALRIELHCDARAARLTIGAPATAWCLPLADMPTVLSATPPPVAAPSPGGPLTGLRVLVADDSRDAANGLAALLRQAGAEAWVVFDGQAALDAAHAHRPAVAVLDLDMPVVDGCEVARRLRATEIGRHMRLVALTGAVRPDDRHRARDAGFDHHLAKPVDVARLTALLAGVAAPRNTTA